MPRDKFKPGNDPRRNIKRVNRPKPYPKVNRGKKANGRR